MICIADKNTIPFPSARDVNCLLLDSDDDVQFLNSRPLMGCVAFVLSTGGFYVSTSSGEWIHYNKNNEVIGSVSTAQSRQDFERGGNIKVKNMSFSVSDGYTSVTRISKDTVFDFGKNDITLDKGFGSGNAVNLAAFYISGSHVTFNGTWGGIKAEDLGTNDGPHCVIIEKGGEVEVNGGYYRGGATAFYVDEGTLIINGGTFASWDKHSYGAGEPHPWTLNCGDKTYKEGKAKIIVRGGTFINFDPSNPKTNDADSYVDEGYKVEKKESGPDVIYTVLKI